MTELGYVEGKNVRIEYREGVLDADYQRLMAEFVDHKVNIILAANAPAAVAAAKATTNIPIVMLAVNDPVGLGLMKSLDRPGTNVTGTTMYAPQLIGERLRVLKSMIPNLDKIAMVMNGNNANNEFVRKLTAWALKSWRWIFGSLIMLDRPLIKPQRLARRLLSMASIASSTPAGSTWPLRPKNGSYRLSAPT